MFHLLDLLLKVCYCYAKMTIHNVNTIIIYITKNIKVKGLIKSD